MIFGLVQHVTCAKIVPMKLYRKLNALAEPLLQANGIISDAFISWAVIFIDYVSRKHGYGVNARVALKYKMKLS